jgi:hypothetical protein
MAILDRLQECIFGWAEHSFVQVVNSRSCVTQFINIIGRSNGELWFVRAQIDAPESCVQISLPFQDGLSAEL